ncbi:MAG: glycoside hydrolase family 17 protein [Gammaproteobacteria bacterium]
MITICSLFIDVPCPAFRRRLPVDRQALRIALVLALAVCAARLWAEPTDKLARVRSALHDIRFVAYTPTDFAVWNGQVKAASSAVITQDLKRLRGDFQGLITYSCANGVEQVPAIAAGLGYRAVIIGVWDINSNTELATAIALARRYPQLIVGVAVGNETLLAKRRPWPVLERRLAEVRRALPIVAVTTSEPFYFYLDNTVPGFLDAQDFLLPSVHPLYQPWFAGASVETDVDFVVQVLNKLGARTDKPILVKETGLPSGPGKEGFTPQRQAQFWHLLETRVRPDERRAIAAFEAFDQPWKAANAAREFGLHPEESYWGFYDVRGRPKPVLAALRAIWKTRPLRQ